MNNKIVDGVELLRMIRDGEIKTGTKITVHTPSYDTDYWFWGNWFGEADGYSKKIDNMELHLCNKDCMFEILSEEEIDIQSIKELDPCAMIPDGMNGTKLYYSVQEGLIIKQQNRIIKAIKQLDKKIK